MSGKSTSVTTIGGKMGNILTAIILNVFVALASIAWGLLFALPVAFIFLLLAPYMGIAALAALTFVNWYWLCFAVMFLISLSLDGNSLKDRDTP